MLKRLSFVGNRSDIAGKEEEEEEVIGGGGGMHLKTMMDPFTASHTLGRSNRACSIHTRHAVAVLPLCLQTCPRLCVFRAQREPSYKALKVRGRTILTMPDHPTTATNTLHSAAPCRTVPCSAVCRCAGVQCRATQCAGVQCRAVQRSVQVCSAVPRSVAQCAGVQCRAVQRSVQVCSAVPCRAAQSAGVQSRSA